MTKKVYAVPAYDDVSVAARVTSLPRLAQLSRSADQL